ncbi:MAG: DUF1028 domain-containing protein [Azospirillaceae bacterium]|nr:DUF1028 domain-containing protein [Azospirillaceae bacterium]
MTFSILACCPETAQLGMAIASSSPAVASRCAWARAGVGVVATQNITDPTLGPRALDLMALGASATQAVEILVSSAAHIDYRQLLVVDARGRTASFSGSQILGIAAVSSGPAVIAGGNLLADPAVIPAMTKAFAAAPSATLGERLLQGLETGLRVGGEAGPVHSASLLVVEKASWPIVDLRIDWADAAPIAALRQAWTVYAPQIGDYVTRALDPRRAPGYGVPGDSRIGRPDGT